MIVHLTIALAIASILFSGCAFYYHDSTTATDHVWGFGHLAIKAIPPNEGKQALLQRATLTGIAIGLDNGSFGFSAGWDRREHMHIYQEDVAITIRRHPADDFWLIKLGTYPPNFGIVPPIENPNTTKEPQP